MATSGSVNFSMSTDDIVNDSLYVIGVLGTGQTIDPNDYVKCKRALNRLVKSLENQMLHIWKRSEFTLFLQPSQASYQFGSSTVIGSTGSDHATESFDQTTISATEAAGQTVLSITSNSGMTNGDFIGIVLDTGYIFWTTIVSSTSTTVTVTDALTSSATAGNVVYSYTTKINKPLKVYDIRRRTVSSSNDIEILEIPYKEYQALPTKSTNGTPYQWVYDRKSNYGTLFVWQPPTDSTYVLKCTYAKPLEDFDASGDNPDLPQEWYDVLVYGLAIREASMFGRTGTQQYQDCKAIYNEVLAAALAADTEGTYIELKPDSRLND